MFSRTRIAFGLALLMILLGFSHVSAKGGFSFIQVSSPDLKETILLSDLALTEDVFAFAEFYENQTDAPANPGPGYEITRFYMDGNREYAYDRLHYYPDSGVVYYDGIVMGSSEFDGEWYKARPGIKAIFEDIVLTKFYPSSSAFTSNNQAGVKAIHGAAPSLPPFNRLAGWGSIFVLAMILTGFWYFRFRPGKVDLPDGSPEVLTHAD